MKQKNKEKICLNGYNNAIRKESKGTKDKKKEEEKLKISLSKKELKHEMKHEQ